MSSRRRLGKAREAAMPKHIFVKILAFVAIGIVVIFTAYSIISNKIAINEYKAQYDELVLKTNATLEENAKISRYLENDENLEAYIEEIAREKLGYAKPDERIYYVIPAANG